MSRIVLFIFLVLVWGFSQERVMTTTLVSDNFEGPGAAQDLGENSDWEVVVNNNEIEAGSLSFGYYERTPSVFQVVGSTIKSSKSFGLQARFKLRGYNWLDVKPRAQKTPYKGVVRSIGVWVWGGRYDYTLEAHFTNQKNEYFRIGLGDVNYYGWKYKKAEIPTSVGVGSVDAVFYDEVGLRFVKFRLTSTPLARRDRFYAFFDYFTVTMDNDRSFYDGFDIERDIDKIFGGTGAGAQQPTTNNNNAPAAAAGS